jgi:hypothetical protein
MKNLKLIFIILGFALLFAACETEERGPVVGVFTPPSISSPAVGGSFVFTDSTENVVMTKFTWTEADFGFQSATIYNVMLDLQTTTLPHLSLLEIRPVLNLKF